MHPLEFPSGVIVSFSNSSYAIPTTARPTEVSPTSPVQTNLRETEFIPYENTSDEWESVGAETLPLILPSSKKMNGTSLYSGVTNDTSSNFAGELPDKQSKIDRILQLLSIGSPDDDKRTIYFGPNGWGGFGNGFRAIRGLALYAVLFQVKLRCR